MSTLIRIVIIGGILFAVYNLQIWEHLAEYIDSQVVYAMLLAGTASLVSFIPSALRTRLMLNKVPRFTPTLKATILSVGLHSVLPARLSEFVKPTFLKIKFDVPLSDSFAVLFIERLLDALCVSMLAVFCLAGFSQGFLRLEFLLGIIALLLLCIPVSVWGSRFLLSKLPDSYSKFHMFLSNITIKLSQLPSFLRNFEVILLTIIIWSTSVATFWIFFSMQGTVKYTLFEVILVFVGTTVAYALPALPGGIGTYEAAAVFIMGYLGTSLEQAIPIALCLHATQLLPAAFVAMFIMLTEKVALSDLRKTA